MAFHRLLCCTAPPSGPPPSTVDLAQFNLLRVIGKGSYARVRVAERKHNSAMYALKIVHKAKCARAGAAPNALQERMLLEEVHHPFLVNMYFAFQDEINCYLVLDLMLGGDLRFHLLRRGSLGENSVRFYVAEISSALAYLHQLGICHRDVKPENILLDLRGHARLTDLNVALHYSESQFHTAVAGTLVYMAPEMVARTGYSWQVDYWSLGITAYELLFFARRPFAPGAKDPARVAHALLHDALVFPPRADAACSAPGRAALAALLDRDPGARLGCRGWSRRRGTAHLRAHPWFRDIDWARLEHRQLAAPFLPDDTTWNFEPFADPDDDRAALRRSLNRLSHLSEKGSAAQRHLEDSFTPYDSEKMPRTSRYPHNEPIGVPPALVLGAGDAEETRGVGDDDEKRGLGDEGKRGME